MGDSLMERIAGDILGRIGGLKPPKSMILGTALLAVFTVASAYITFKEIEKERTG